MTKKTNGKNDAPDRFTPHNSSFSLVSPFITTTPFLRYNSSPEVLAGGDGVLEGDSTVDARFIARRNTPLMAVIKNVRRINDKIEKIIYRAMMRFSRISTEVSGESALIITPAS
jgi:hypothetical protein